MKSGLEGRNKPSAPGTWTQPPHVSMKSGLEGRNNDSPPPAPEARPSVSMKSGLEGRNKCTPNARPVWPIRGLNEVRPRRPEQMSNFTYWKMADVSQ